jgi:hypothetical protein
VHQQDRRQHEQHAGGAVQAGAQRQEQRDPDGEQKIERHAHSQVRLLFRLLMTSVQPRALQCGLFPDRDWVDVRGTSRVLPRIHERRHGPQRGSADMRKASIHNPPASRRHQEAMALFLELFRRFAGGLYTFLT